MKSNINPRLELSTEEMRTYGYKVVDHIIDHFANLPNKKPVSQASRREMDELLMEEVPEGPEDAEAVLEHVFNNVLTHTDLLPHPKFYSFVPSASNFISVMADSLATAYNIFAGGWTSSPAGAEVEIVTANWLLKLFGFPVKKGGGLFTSGGSMANLTGLATARHVKCGESFDRAMLYLSDQAHSSNIRAAKVLGFRRDQIRIIPTDTGYAMRMDLLEKAIVEDRNAGNKPFCVMATAGATNTGTVDPLKKIAKICGEEDLWMHVDAAFGGGAILSEKGKTMLEGIEKAHSVTVDPHKWFFQPYEIGCILVRDHRWLHGTFSQQPEYLRDLKGNAGEINFHNFGVQLTRRFRALKFYVSLKTFGLASFRVAVENAIELTERIEEYLKANANFEVVSGASLAVINFRFNPAGSPKKWDLNKLNQQISSEIIRSQEAMLATTILQGKVVLRMCLINPRVTFESVTETLTTCEAIGKRIISVKK